MSSISVISKSKVSPAPDPKPLKNNFVKTDLNIIKQSKCLIYVELLLGINRLFLLQYKKILTISSIIYSVIFAGGNVAYSLQRMIGGVTYRVTKLVFIMEYTLFVIIALTSSKNKLTIFFKNLSSFDTTLNIQNDFAITSSMLRINVWTSASILCNSFEILLLYLIYHPPDLLLTFGMFVMTMAHDIEQVFFFTYLRDIYMRILILKAHAVKLFGGNRKPVKTMNKVDKLSEKMQFDVSSLHRLYELLHKCSEQLNSTMNIPILLIFFTSSLSTIMLLKHLVSIMQMDNPKLDVKLSILYVVFRCLKHTILVVIPCYYSSVTAAQTTIIRTILHDAVNTIPMNKIERRKVKTFFHLTRESDFTYAICGVIRLNMSLPLSYMSLCTTYLVIIIQFSKFID